MLGLHLSIWSVAPGESGPLIALSANTVPEDAVTTVGTFSVIFGSGTYTFSLTSNPGDLFAIVGNALKVAIALDYETTTSHQITIEADNGVDPAFEREFTIFVEDVVEGPPPSGGVATYHVYGF